MDSNPGVTRTTHTLPSPQNLQTQGVQQFADMLGLDNSVVEKLPESGRKLIQKLFGGAPPAITFSEKTDKLREDRRILHRPEQLHHRRCRGARMQPQRGRGVESRDRPIPGGGETRALVRRR